MSFVRFLIYIYILQQLIPEVSSEVRCGISDTYCEDKYTCCPMRDGWGCCPYYDGTCCLDEKHCCPSGYQCQGSGCSRKIKSNQNSFLSEFESFQKKLQKTPKTQLFFNGFLKAFSEAFNISTITGCYSNTQLEISLISQALNLLVKGTTTDQRVEGVTVFGKVISDFSEFYENCTQLNQSFQNIKEGSASLGNNWKEISYNLIKNMFQEGTKIWADIEDIRKSIKDGKWERAGYDFGNIIVIELTSSNEIEIEITETNNITLQSETQ